jgi:xanthine dehydrogenase large subunit
LMERLKKCAAEELNADEMFITIKDEYVYVKGIRSDLDWKKLVMITYLKRISLSEHAHYATPDIHYDASIEKGHPFAYHVYGTAVITVTVDCLRGTYSFDSVYVVHDSGSGKSETIDKGQCEGGIVQGIGWMTMEEIFFDDKGRLRSKALSTYKVPDVYSVPKEISIHFMRNDNDNLALMKTKAVGEPPLMYGIGAYFAIRNAISAFNADANIKFDAPFTPEKVLLSLYHKKKEAAAKV